MHAQNSSRSPRHRLSMAMLGFILALLVLNPSATSASKGSNFKWSLSHSHSKQLAVNDAGLAEANGTLHIVSMTRDKGSNGSSGGGGSTTHYWLQLEDSGEFVFLQVPPGGLAGLMLKSGHKHHIKGQAVPTPTSRRLHEVPQDDPSSDPFMFSHLVLDVTSAQVAPPSPGDPTPAPSPGSMRVAAAARASSTDTVAAATTQRKIMFADVQWCGAAAIYNKAALMAAWFPRLTMWTQWCSAQQDNFEQSSLTYVVVSACGTTQCNSTLGGDCAYGTNCPYYTYKNLLYTQLKSMGYNTDSYDHIIMAIPSTFNCPGIGGLGSYWPVNSVWAMKDYASDPSLVAHEVHHNLGLAHASKAAEEYGDQTDVMGEANMEDGSCLNGPHMWQLGWVDAAVTLSSYQFGSGTTDTPVVLPSLGPATRAPLLRINLWGVTSSFVTQTAGMARIGIWASFSLNTGKGVRQPTVNIHQYDGDRSQGAPVKTAHLYALTPGQSATVTGGGRSITIKFVSYSASGTSSTATGTAQLVVTASGFSGAATTCPITSVDLCDMCNDPYLASLCGATCSACAQCTDGMYSCASWAFLGYCSPSSQYYTYIKNTAKCNRACGFCSLPSSGIAAVVQSPPPPPAAVPACADLSSTSTWCSVWKSQGACTSPASLQGSFDGFSYEYAFPYVNFMSINCAATCGTCASSGGNPTTILSPPPPRASPPPPPPSSRPPPPSPVNCVDIDANCAYYNSKGYCSSTQYAAFMAQNCAATCKLCTPKTSPPPPSNGAKSPPPRPPPPSSRPPSPGSNTARSPPPSPKRSPPPPPPAKKRPPPPPPASDYYSYDYISFGTFGSTCKDVTQTSLGPTSCAAWKSSGYCSKSSSYYQYMQALCPKTCGFC